jgi:hypothetical protein
LNSKPQYSKKKKKRKRRKKFFKGKKSQVCMSVIPATCEAEIGRIIVRGQPTHSSQDPISKITRAKWPGGVAQEVEYLLCPEFTPHSHQKKKKEKE